MLKVNKENLEATNAKEEDKAFRKDFWKTAKQFTNGTFGEPPSKPTFTKSTASQFYKEKYEKPTVINIEQLDWFLEVESPTKEYNLSPYTPKNIKNAQYCTLIFIKNAFTAQIFSHSLHTDLRPRGCT